MGSDTKTEPETTLVPDIEKSTLKSALTLYFGDPMQQTHNWNDNGDDDGYGTDDYFDDYFDQQVGIFKPTPEAAAQAIFNESVRTGQWSFKYCPLEPCTMPTVGHDDEDYDDDEEYDDDDDDNVDDENNDDENNNDDDDEKNNNDDTPQPCTMRLFKRMADLGEELNQMRKARIEQDVERQQYYLERKQYYIDQMVEIRADIDAVKADIDVVKVDVDAINERHTE